MGSKFKSVFTEEYKLFLAHFRATRLAAGLTQEALAQRLGEYQIFISRCERGERRVDAIELRAFCRAMDVPVVQFMQELDTALNALETKTKAPAKQASKQVRSKRGRPK